MKNWTVCVIWKQLQFSFIFKDLLVDTWTQDNMTKEIKMQKKKLKDASLLNKDHASPAGPLVLFRGANKETVLSPVNVILNEHFYLQPCNQNMRESNLVSYSAAFACLGVQWLLQTGPPALLWQRRGPTKQAVTDGPSHNALTPTHNSVWTQEYYANTTTPGNFSFPKSENDFVDLSGTYKMKQHNKSTTGICMCAT